MLSDKNELKFDTYLYAKKFKEANKWGNEDPGHHRADNDARVNVDVYFKLRELK